MKYFLLNSLSSDLKSWLIYICSFCILAGCSQEISVPKTKSIDHFDEYHGQKVSDPYRWLEDFTNDAVKFGDANFDGIVDEAEMVAVGSVRTIYLVLLITHVTLAGVICLSFC